MWKKAKPLLLFLSVLLISTFILTRPNIRNWARLRLSRLGATAVSPPDFTLTGSGQNVDSLAFWQAPNPADTLLFVTAKQNTLVEVWQFPFVGQEQQPLRHPSFGNSQVNGVAVDQTHNLLFISIASPAATVSVFSLPELTFSHSFIDGQADLGAEPGIDLYQKEGEETLAYITADSSQNVHIHNAATGAEIGVVNLRREMETVLVDDFYDVVYIPDENGRSGIYAYNLDLSPYSRSGKAVFGKNAFQNDAEGAVLYRCMGNGRDTGQGFIVVSDQRRPETELEFFDRQSWAHLGNLHFEGVSNTDGLGSTQIPLPGYPLGLLAAVNDDSSVAAIGWDNVLNSMNLKCP